MTIMPGICIREIHQRWGKLVLFPSFHPFQCLQGLVKSNEYGSKLGCLGGAERLVIYLMVQFGAQGSPHPNVTSLS